MCLAKGIPMFGIGTQFDIKLLPRGRMPRGSATGLIPSQTPLGSFLF